jgi:hypothetical protein
MFTRYEHFVRFSLAEGAGDDQNMRRPSGRPELLAGSLPGRLCQITWLSVLREGH